MTAPRQLPLDFQHRPALSRDDLVASAENEQALSLIDSWPDWPAPVAVIVGPGGAGKSHLLSVFIEASDAVDAATDFEAAMEAAGEGRAVVWDDADRRLRDDRQLFHLINAVRNGGATLLMSAERLPVAWDVGLPDLASRLRAVTCIELREPGDALLQAVIVKLFADRQMEIDPHVLRFITRRMERSLAAAIRVVEMLDHAALERGRPITRALAAEILGSEDRDDRQ